MERPVVVLVHETRRLPTPSTEYSHIVRAIVSGPGEGDKPGRGVGFRGYPGRPDGDALAAAKLKVSELIIVDD